MNTLKVNAEQLTKKDILWTEYEDRTDLKARYILEEIDRLKETLKDSAYEYNFNKMFGPKIIQYLNEIANNLGYKITENVVVVSGDQSIPGYYEALKIMKEQIYQTEKGWSLNFSINMFKNGMLNILMPEETKRFLNQITPDSRIKLKKAS
jgi:hypothetical protein